MAQNSPLERIELAKVVLAGGSLNAEGQAEVMSLSESIKQPLERCGRGEVDQAR